MLSRIKLINLILLSSFFLLALIPLAARFHFFEKKTTTLFPLNEKFDKNLSRLNNLNSMLVYWDSATLAEKPKTAREHIWLANNLIMHRFYHDYSHYSFQENPIAYLSGKLVWNNLSAIVIPDDLLKYEMAACSQQCIVMMELLKLRGYKVRKVGFVEKSGHFCIEVFYDNSWHFYDPNKEPKFRKYFPDNRPDVKTLISNKNNLYNVYENIMTKEQIDAVFGKYIVGSTNEFPAKKAKAFHYITYYTSFYGWIFTLLLIIVINYEYILNKMYSLMKNRVAIPT